MATLWALAPGDRVRRTDLHAQYGGRRQGGISPSLVTSNVFLFSDPASGLKHGYIDHWDGRIFHYTGEGQRGDQQLISGNGAVLQHASHKRALRLFRGARGVVQYVGEFSLDLESPVYATDAPETGGGPVRQVIVFRLRPGEGAEVSLLPAPNLQLTPGVDEVPIAAANTEKFWVEPDRQPYAAELREAVLVAEFKAWMEQRGYKVSRLKIVPPGEGKPIFNDVWLPALNLLVEAKGTCTREAVRMAIGQLIDYGRAKPDARRAILLPSPPRPDLTDLINTAGVMLIWPIAQSGRFQGLMAGAKTLTDVDDWSGSASSVQVG